MKKIPKKGDVFYRVYDPLVGGLPLLPKIQKWIFDGPDFDSGIEVCTGCDHTFDDDNDNSEEVKEEEYYNAYLFQNAETGVRESFPLELLFKTEIEALNDFLINQRRMKSYFEEQKYKLEVEIEKINKSSAWAFDKKYDIKVRRENFDAIKIQEDRGDGWL